MKNKLLLAATMMLFVACSRTTASPTPLGNSPIPAQTATAGPQPIPTYTATPTTWPENAMVPTEQIGELTPTVTKETPNTPSTTPLPTATPTNPPPTPEPTETIESPYVIDFQVSPTTADPNEVVTLNWDVVGSQATICPSSQFDLFSPDDCLQVPPSGEMTFTIPPEAAGVQHISFLLTAQTENHAPVVEQVSVFMKCPTTWFFSDESQAGVCPLEPIHSYAAAQRFEHGAMIWIEELGQYLILEDNLLYEGEARKRLSQAYDPLDIIQDTSAEVQAPEGHYAPESGFGLVWRGDVSGSAGYQDSLGWALAPEFGYQTTFQCDDAPPSGGRSWQFCHLQGPDGEIIVLHPLGGWYLHGEQ